MKTEIRFDPNTNEYRNSPHQVFRHFRELDPVNWGVSPHAGSPGTWYLFRHEDVSKALRDPNLIHDRTQLLSSDQLAQTLTKPPGLSESFVRYSRRFLVATDPPAHTRIRALVSKAFTPHTVQALRDSIASAAMSLTGELESGSTVDIVDSFAGPLPLQMVAAMLGVPVSNYDEFRKWSHDLSATIEDPSFETLLKASMASDALSECLLQVMQQRRKEPQLDLLSSLLAAEDDGIRLSEDEIIATCMMLLVAGHETTASLIASALYYLLSEPTRWRRITEQPLLIANAVEETLRFEPPGRIAIRWAANDLTIRDKQIKRGDRIGLVVASANRDPEVFEDPDLFDIERDASKHLSFGAGIHYCLGAYLARTEAEIAVRLFAQRFPEASIVHGGIEWQNRISINGPECMMVSL